MASPGEMGRWARGLAQEAAGVVERRIHLPGDRRPGLYHAHVHVHTHPEFSVTAPLMPELHEVSRASQERQTSHSFPFDNLVLGTQGLSRAGLLRCLLHRNHVVVPIQWARVAQEVGFLGSSQVERMLPVSLDSAVSGKEQEMSLESSQHPRMLSFL